MKRLIPALLLLTLAASPILARQTTEPAPCDTVAASGASAAAEQASVEYAEGFTIEYGDSYKVITVTQPWPGADASEQYVLVPCGVTPPDGYPDAQVVTVPVQRAVSMSTTYLPSLVELGLLDRLVGLDEFDFVYSPDVRALIEDGALVEIGGGAGVNVEQAIALEPDVIFSYGIGSTDYDAYPALRQAGLTVVLNGDFAEADPLGRAEWVKFIAAFFNEEAAANALFDQIVTDYTALAETAASADGRPSVLTNAMYGDTWYASGGRSYIARLIADAGGRYIWDDDESTGGLPLSFEAVVERGQDADYWINPNFWSSLADGLAEDERYATFSAFADERVYNNVAAVTPLGGNDYTESGALHPERILADLIAIFHPELMPGHAFNYYVHLQ